MTQDKLETQKKTKATLGLSTKKLGVKIPNKNLSNNNLSKKNKGTVIVVTKTKSLKITDSKNNNELTDKERQDRLKAILNSDSLKSISTNLDTKENNQNNEQSLNKKQVSEIKEPNPKDQNEIKNLDHIGKIEKEKVNNTSFEQSDSAGGKHKTNLKAQNDIKNKYSDIDSKNEIVEDKKANKKKSNIISKKESKKLSLTEIYNLEKEEEVFETKIKTIKVHSKSKNKEHKQSKQEKIYREVKISEQISVQELANKIAEKSATVIKTLMNLGIIATINQTIDGDTAELVVQELGHIPIRVDEENIKKSLFNEVEDNPDSLKHRAPIVTIMGHVDHGKTSLLDALRSTDIASSEHGGITQHIGAYNVSLNNNNSITFLDTPGHAAFTAMRMRGAKITDIVIIVVAADDGIKEQTIEAINHAKAANVPIIVAINKIDKPEANIDKVKNLLFTYELVPEDMGGDVMVIPVSAKNKIGLDSLEEAILIQAEVLDLKANPDRYADGVIIESKLDKYKGVLATLLVQKGTLKIGDMVIINNDYFKIRSLINDKGQKVKNALPSMPVEVLGLNKTPEAGEKFLVVENEKIAKKIVEYNNKDGEILQSNENKKTFNDLLKNQIGNLKTLNLILKADVHGSLEAIKTSLQKISNEDVEVKISHSIVGSISESDISLAKVTGSTILGFNVRADSKTVKLAKTLGVNVKYYSIIYDLIDDVKSMASGLISPVKKENITGYAEIRQVINISKVGKIAGCMVTEGIIKKKSHARLLRDNIVIYDGKLGALKRFKDDVKEVKTGFECGISFEKFSDFKENDKFEAYEMIEEQNK
ncbi:translation initiation factor IF-2 [Rickettsiales endosymbiont of Trichoplax sp. H2]|uniref:translation initiation factor IF-2 n=1 Tax=Rickettsiales endosymbiont of Trichoplax sp. H2 TaxID=2021221 RepID=UPI0012B25E89|nr:translation initiation factor IF-2 [Rickettsiales endosymbiont of Trichoplax sp. H2]MSO13259.1 Translation initiation factor IF-2 [Rickettsiales endosymbiont of Trichoplax sp. H2]